ncbi:MAG: PrsW family intramembrane metalloprotease, partial [Halovenus sp.]
MNPRKLLRIARWEVTKNAGGLDRRTVVIVIVAVAGLGLVAPVVGTGGVGVDDGIYRVAVDEDSQYYDVVATDPTFTVREANSREVLERGTVDIWIDERGVEPADSRKGAAAYEELRESVSRYNNRELTKEANQTAAFPVSVTVEFREQASLNTSLGGGTGDGDDAPSSGSGDGSPDADPGDDSPNAGDEDPDTDSPATGDNETGDGSTSDGESDSPAPGGVTGPLSEEELSGSPADINPPFPFQSLVLAFIFVIPLNFLIQAYGSTMLSERLKRRGELLLVSPVTRLDIIGGKTLPYFAGAMAVEGAIAVGLVYVARGELGGLLSVLAIT